MSFSRLSCNLERTGNSSAATINPQASSALTLRATLFCEILGQGRAGKQPLTGTLLNIWEFDNLMQGWRSGSDGRAFVTDVNKARVVAFSKEGRSSIVAKDILGTSLVVTHIGLIYVVEPGAGDENGGKLWLLNPDGKKLQLDAGLRQPSGIGLSPDGLWLAVAKKTHWGYCYRVQPDGTLKDKERFYWFHVPDDADDSGARAWVMDHDGRLYAATRMGVQVFDRNGRSRLIMPVPGRGSDRADFQRQKP
jgi:hypothetical protein